MRCVLLGACILLVANVASARTETAAQQFKPGAVVKLRALDVEMKLPPSAEGWTVSLAVEGSDAWDILHRLDSTRGELSLELSRARVADCNAVASTLDAQKAKKHANSPLAPSSFEPWSYGVATGAQRLCTNTFNGPVTADVSGTSLDAAEVSALLGEVASLVAGRRGTAGLVAKEPTVAHSGTMLLPASGVQADVPKGWAVHVVTNDAGNKVDLLERDAALRVTIERRTASCATSLPQGNTVLDASYLPAGFGPAAIETRAKDVRTTTFCRELGADAIIVSVSFAGELTHPDVRVVKTILAPTAAGQSAVGTSVASDHEVDDREDDMTLGARTRGSAALDLLYFSARGESNHPFGGGLSLDVYSSTAKYGLGFAVEIGGRGGVGTNKFLTWDVFGGVGGALTFGRFVGMLTVGGGADAFHGVRYKDNQTFFEAEPAGYVHVAPRLLIPLARKLALDVRGAYVHRFNDGVGHELRGHLGVAYDWLWIGVRATQYSDRALLASLGLGLSF